MTLEKMLTYDAVIFDMDGTLIDSMWLWIEVDRLFLESREILLPEDLNEAIEGMSFEETAAYFKETFALEESLEEIMGEFHQRTVDYYENKIFVKEGVVQLLDYLAKKKMTMAIATSNALALAQKALENNGIDHYFETLVTSSMVDRGKPAPDVFLKTARELGVSPSRCLVFEDTHAGVLGAKAAGMDVVAVHDEASAGRRKHIEADADHFLYSIDLLFREEAK